jgi:hypothetical protein
MDKRGRIDPSEVTEEKLSEELDLSCLDCTEENGSDPLGIQEFAEKETHQ